MTTVNGGMYAYASTLNGEKPKDVQITIKKAENGYIFELQGMKEVPKTKEPQFDRFEHFETTFVYQDLEIGLNEISSFFTLIEEELKKKVKKTVTIAQKNGRGRPKKSNGN